MKIKDLLKITGISLLGVLGVGLSIFGSAKGMTLLADNYSQASAYYVNDNQESVTFTKEELNNCSYSYLTYSLSQQYDLTSNYIIYNGVRFNYNDYDEDRLKFEDEDTNDIRFWFNDTIGQFAINDEISNFQYPLTIYSDFFAENMQKSITLSASQLNNNTYEYFRNYFVDEGDFTVFADSYIIYENNVYNYNGNIDNEYISYTNNETEKEINFTYLEGENYDWQLFDNNEGEELTFTNSITIYSTYIADNLYAPNQPTNLLQAIVSLLTGGIVGLSGGIGSGVSTLTTQIFISNNALSVFGGMIVVFAGISLAIGLCRWIMQFLTSLGAKK